jgi:hypothetical protein
VTSWIFYQAIFLADVTLVGEDDTS